MMDFLVVKVHLSYKAIIRQPTLNSLHVVTSINHLKMKFPMEVGNREVRGEHVLDREYYVQELKDEGNDVCVAETSQPSGIPPPPPLQLIKQGIKTRDRQHLK